MKSWGHFYSQEINIDYFIKNIFFHLPLFKSIYQQNPTRILEIGSGTATMSIFLSYLGLQVTSLENDKKVLKEAKKLVKKFKGRVNFILGDAFRLPFEDKSFDVVFHQGLLEHFKNEDIFKLLNEHLRVGQIVVFSVPNNYYPQRDFGNERLLSQKYWEKLLSGRYRFLESRSYHPLSKTLLGGRLIFRVVNTMYLGKIGKR